MTTAAQPLDPDTAAREDDEDGGLDQRERELKLEIPAASLRAVAKRLAGLPGAQKRGVAARLKAVYFDTPDHDLRAADATLRIRRRGRGRVQTIKIGAGGAGLFDRLELERPVRGDAPALIPEEVAMLASACPGFSADTEVAALFSTDVKRTTFDVERGGAAIEVALDDAVVEAGEERAAFCEIELELKAGDPQALFALARELGETAPLRVGVLAKSARGYALLEAKRPRAVKPPRSPIRAAMDVEGALSSIVADCVAQFRGNEDILLDAPGPKAIHAARVALRRLRSGFSMFRQAIADPASAAVAAEIKWLAGELGAARDLDVFVKERLSDDEPGQGVARLVERVEARRQDAYASALDALASRRALDATLALVEWAAIGAWRRAPETAELRATPIVRFAATTLDKRLSTLKKRARGLTALPPEELHEARIAGKKLRYAADFFGELYDGKAAKRRKSFIGRMTDLQDLLGELNDIATTRTLSEGLAEEATAESDAGGAFQAGMVAGRAEAGRAARLAAADRTLAKLMDAKPFWR